MTEERLPRMSYQERVIYMFDKKRKEEMAIANWWEDSNNAADTDPHVVQREITIALRNAGNLQDEIDQLRSLRTK